MEILDKRILHEILHVLNKKAGLIGEGSLKDLIQNHNKNAKENLFAIIFRNESAIEKIKNKPPGP